MISAPVRAGFTLLVVLACGAASCAKRSARVATPAGPARIGSQETGIASWYGIPYHGRRTASGEIYDMEKLTAAHRDLPFQTWVEVTNLDNGKRVDVRITDRGPFVRGRIIDLSHRAARDIEMLGPGVVKVRIKVIPPPAQLPEEPDVPPAPNPQVVSPVVAPKTVPASASADVTPSVETPGYAVQAGAFADRARAEAFRSRLVEEFAEARVIPGSNSLWRVIIGRQMSLEQANNLAARVRQQIGSSLIVREPESVPSPSARGEDLPQ